jgi:hypothetical protein
VIVKKFSKKKKLTVFEQHALNIARANAKMPPAIAAVLGGPSPSTAREIVKELERKMKGK